MNEILSYLESNGISYRRYDHPPIYTCEEANKHLSDAEGQRTKNVFLRDQKKRNYILVLCPDEKQVDLKTLAENTGLGRLSFASADDLKRLLGIEAGAVSVLALLNDAEAKVRLFIDRELWGGAAFQCHPLVNTATLVISREDLEKFLALSSHGFELIDIPAHA